jgi:hypothetical protein|tara:strand:+ start:75 stop:509 length:435 start_codon:yes stop_codon:yes gene_type:complete
MEQNKRKTDIVEITDDMSYGTICVVERENKITEQLERIKCFSVYTPNMEIGDVERCKYTGVTSGTTMVMLELPTELVKNSIEVSKEVNEKWRELSGEDKDYGVTPFDILQDEYEKTSLQHEPSVVVEDYVNENFSPEEMEKWGY